MAGGFLRKWFGKAASPSQEAEEARADLDRLAKERPALRESILLIRDVLPHCAPAEAISAPVLDSQQAKRKLASGVPLLRGEDWSPDEKDVRPRWQALCAAIRDCQQDDAAAALANASRGLDLGGLTREVLAGNVIVVQQKFADLGLDPSLAATVLRLTLFPLLVPVGAALLSLREGVHWQPGYCPTCGCWPLLGEFRGLEQTRYLRCGLCASEWEFPRSTCAFCGNRDYKQLGFLHIEGEETSYRAATCDVCRGYVKMMSTLSALPSLQLLVADVATLHLDLIANERGYTNPPV